MKKRYLRYNSIISKLGKRGRVGLGELQELVMDREAWVEMNISIISESSIGQCGLREETERAVFDWVRRASLETNAIAEKRKRGQLWVGGVLGTRVDTLVADVWWSFTSRWRSCFLPHLVLEPELALSPGGDRAGHCTHRCLILQRLIQQGWAEVKMMDQKDVAVSSSHKYI